jgi:hypothetical protein
MANQTYENHRHNPRLTGIGFLFVVLALVAFALRVFSIAPGAATIVGVTSLIAADLVLLVISRSYTTKLQDRIIRLEMRLRCAERLTSAQLGIASRLPTASIIALRFASDEELPELIERAERDRLTPDQIKRTIRNWVPDWDRT